MSSAIKSKHKIKLCRYKCKMHGFKKHFVDNINVSDFLAEMFSYLSSVIACCGPDCQWKIHHVFTHKNTQNNNQSKSQFTSGKQSRS